MNQICSHGFRLYISGKHSSFNKYIWTRVRHRAGSSDEMRWSPFTEGLWIARISVDHAWRTVTGADEMKWNELNMCGESWNEICGRGKREKHREKPIQTPFRPPRSPQGVTETWTLDPSGGRRHPTACAAEPPLVLMIYKNTLSIIVLIIPLANQRYDTIHNWPITAWLHW